MRSSESLVVFYLAYVCLLAWARPMATRRRSLVTGLAAADALVIWWLSDARGHAGLAARDWSPAVQILLAYWFSGAFFRAPMPHVEAWLAQWDRVLFTRFGGRRLTEQAPRLLLEYFELAYLSVYAIVPAGFAVVYFTLPSPPVDAYWTTVLAAELACYAMLPWIQTRPPRSLGVFDDVDERRLFFRQVNHRILRASSIQVNTVPSGHAAGAIATALAAGALVPVAFLPLVIAATCIVIASVLGRYHYAFDSALGVVVALAIWIGVS